MKLRTLLSINAWACVIDAAVAFGTLFLCTWGVSLLPLVRLLLAVVFAYLFYLAMALHSQTGRKYRSWVLLFSRNRRQFRPESFGPYMSAPCGRALVRDVLIELNQRQQYAKLKQQYFKGFFSSDDSDVLIIVPWQDSSKHTEGNQNGEWRA